MLPKPTGIPLERKNPPEFLPPGARMQKREQSPRALSNKTSAALQAHSGCDTLDRRLAQSRSHLPIAVFDSTESRLVENVTKYGHISCVELLQMTWKGRQHVYAMQKL